LGVIVPIRFDLGASLSSGECQAAVRRACEDDEAVQRQERIGTAGSLAFNSRGRVRPALIAIGVVGILAVAAVLRFADLGSNPGGLYMDEAAEALSAQRILHDPSFRPVFIPDGGGREALFAYLVAFVFHLVGETPLALRATAAGIGVAGVLGVWLLARRYGLVAGLGAAAWAAGSLWLICISRNGMRNTLVPLFATLAMAGLLAWHDRPGRPTAILAGATASLATFYTYQPLKLIPLLVLVWLVWLHRVNRPAYERLRVNLPAFAVAFLAIGAPMLVAAVTDPASYFGRAADVTFGAGSPVVVPAHWLRTLGMFAVTGDPNPRHDVAQLPLLGWPLFALALGGTVRLWRGRREPTHALVLWSLPIFLIPPLIATEGGAPHFLRALGLAAPMAMTIGMGIGELIEGTRARWGRMPARAVATAMAFGLAALAIGSGRAYLSRPVADRYDAYRYALVAMAAVARTNDVVVLDDYSATVVRFMDAGRVPNFAAPGSSIPAPAPHTRVLALTLEDLRTALGTKAAQRAAVVARDPRGDPALWVVEP
jgi:4-amino-4-deoxy-L-arabinose transferase-like glycosyltransferase